jgi:hypothetical protein
MWSEESMRLVGSARLLIAVPLLVVPLTFLTASHASAAPGAAEEAVRLLAKARAADGLCNYLSASERAELARYAARAEHAATSQAGADAAKSAARSGAAQGLAETCSADLKADVRETLVAAREAAASAGKSQPVKPTPAAATPADQPPLRASDGNASLIHYKRAVRAYYLERECRSLSKAEATRFWTGIVRLHRKAVAANGVAAVKPLMLSAETRAKSLSCGKRAMVEIRRGYEDIVSR